MIQVLFVYGSYLLKSDPDAICVHGSESRANHISLALIGMGEDPSCGQMAKVKVTEWFQTIPYTSRFQRASKCQLMSRSRQACMRCKERTNAGVISFLPAEAFWQMAAWQRARMRPPLVNFFLHLPLGSPPLLYLEVKGPPLQTFSLGNIDKLPGTNIV